MHAWASQRFVRVPVQTSLLSADFTGHCLCTLLWPRYADAGQYLRLRGESPIIRRVASSVLKANCFNTRQVTTSSDINRSKYCSPILLLAEWAMRMTSWSGAGFLCLKTSGLASLCLKIILRNTQNAKHKCSIEALCEFTFYGKKILRRCLWQRFL